MALSSSITYKDILLLILSAIITLSLALFIIRQFAPTLLGLPDDMVLVQSSEEVPPFYENAIRREDIQSKEYLLKDPITKVRAKPFFSDLGGIGPNDLLGFRNTSIPNKADVVFIGDSQIYGNNATIWQNIPHRVQQILPRGSVVYSMATAGWGAPQYLYAFAKSLVFEPEVIVIAFYTGNDSLDTFSLVKSSNLWDQFASEIDIGEIDPPKSKFPPPEDQQWPVSFKDGTETVLTPELRHGSNRDHPAVNAAYEIIKNIAGEIARKAKQQGIKAVFTIIPTKEYVYSKKIERDNIKAPNEYRALIRDERRRIKELAGYLDSLKHAVYVDLTKKLSEEALGSELLYPANSNGHPNEFGYRIIAKEIAPRLASLINVPSEGFAIRTTPAGMEIPVYVRGGGFFIISGDKDDISDLVKGEARKITAKELSGFKFRGYVSSGVIKANLDNP